MIKGGSIGDGEVLGGNRDMEKWGMVGCRSRREEWWVWERGLWGNDIEERKEKEGEREM
jgi:hypothetical protein